MHILYIARVWCITVLLNQWVRGCVVTLLNIVVALACCLFPCRRIEQGVCYLTLSDRGYPKKLAYQYLEDLQREFSAQNGAQVETVARPYAFIKFDTIIQRTKKLYLDTRTQRNLNKLNEDLHDIQSVMTRNIQDILGQGERLDHVSNMSETLANETRKYSSKAKELSRQALIQKYLPLVVVLAFVLLLLFFRYFVFAKKKK